VYSCPNQENNKIQLTLLGASWPMVVDAYSKWNKNTISAVGPHGTGGGEKGGNLWRYRWQYTLASLL